MVALADFDLVTLAALVQTIVLVVTAVILILQFRSQERATKEAAYQKILDDYNDVIRVQMERPELALMFNDLVKASPEAAARWGQRTLSNEENLVRIHVMMIYGLLERVYILYDKEWIDRDTWTQWDAWLVAMAQHPMFGQVHRGSRGMFDRSFEEHVARVLDNASKDA